MQHDNALVVVSISPQSKASLSHRFNLGNADETHRKLRRFLRTLSVDVLLDTTFGREFSLVEMAQDVMSHIDECKTARNSPVLASSCPGWVCYAEKHKENKILVPLISRTKSPQQVMGFLVKHYLPAQRPRYHDCRIVHATVMPCFDKKLEASRNEFSFVSGGDQDERERDVDIVLSTLEIEKMAMELQYDFDAVGGAVEEDAHEVEEMWVSVYLALISHGAILR